MPEHAVEDALARPGLDLGRDLEARFEAATGPARIASTRQLLAVGFITYIIALGADAAHGALRIGLALRVGMVAPIALLSIVLLSSRRPIWQQGLLTSLPIFLGLSSIVFIGLSLIGCFPELYLTSAGMAAFCVNVGIPLRFRHAWLLSLANVCCTISLVFAFGGANDPGKLLGTLAFISFGTIVTLAFNYRTEQNSRNIFLYGLRDRLRAEAFQRANAELTRLSTTDPLTGLANRRAFGVALERSRLQARRGQAWYGLLLIDVDHFKALNDTLGHAAGDGCLEIVARAIQAEIRGGIDTAARYGGEEFAVILPGCDAAAIEAAAERIRLAIAQCGMPNPGLGPDRRITVSIGATACAAGEDLSSDELLRRTDAALYRAKSLGRDAVVVNMHSSEIMSLPAGVL